MVTASANDARAVARGVANLPATSYDRRDIGGSQSRVNAIAREGGEVVTELHTRSMRCGKSAWSLLLGTKAHVNLCEISDPPQDTADCSNSQAPRTGSNTIALPDKGPLLGNS